MTEIVASLPLPVSAVQAVDAARRGSGSGWDWIFDRYYTLVLRYAMARVGDRSVAEDVAQEVFVGAVRSIRRLRDHSPAGIEAWLLGIARNKCRDEVRRLLRERHKATPAPPSQDVAEVALARLTTAELRLSMAALTDDQRDVLVRRFVLDQSLEQVAAAMRRPVGAVKSMQHRALASLARAHGGDGR